MKKIKEALKFFEENYGEDVEVISVEDRESMKFVRIVWQEDDTKYFSHIGKGRFGKLTELGGGEL